MTTATVRDENNSLYVSGNLNFQTVKTVWEESLPFITRYQKLNFNFSGVTQVNSAALALLLEWLQYAKKHQKPIFFTQLPAQLKSIASVAGIEPMLTQIT
jgi:phospholipid transport system transporter-binding protein